MSDYLFSGSACLYPGVRRPPRDADVKKREYSEIYKAIIDDNEIPRHIWCFLEINRSYAGNNWKNSGLSAYELAHIFAHKESEIRVEQPFFREIYPDLRPYGDFSCARNVILLPKGTVRPTDNSPIIKAAFYQRYFDLYGETPLRGRYGFKSSLVPDWYADLVWNAPFLPMDWEPKIENLLKHRMNLITDKIRGRR
jgi:hypothetical protein